MKKIVLKVVNAGYISVMNTDRSVLICVIHESGEIKFQETHGSITAEILNDINVVSQNFQLFYKNIKID